MTCQSSSSDVARMADLLTVGAPQPEVHAAAHQIRMRLNPHPAGQLLLNAPSLAGRPLPGLQHKYPETVLFFPKQGQTCHAYCAYCFRWAQFVDEPELKMATDHVDTLVAYLHAADNCDGSVYSGQLYLYCRSHPV